MSEIKVEKVHNTESVNLDSKLELPANNEYNLSDFALFLSVMNNREAYQSTLSIIMDEPHIELLEVKVEQVILNNQGKRAIRLDAWVRSSDERQFNLEMQNDSGNDSIPKRSRFYQSMMDAPILKSGKYTKYRDLSSTVIIFITQEDIFGRDMAKYTFSEQCEEISDLKLEDGTKKIFLNMKSKNGSNELISLLQYMKNTSLDNPDIIVKDERLIKLDAIVNEVRTSDVWEDFKMNIYSRGIELGMEQGKEQGIEKGIQALIINNIEEGIPEERTLDKIASLFDVTKEQAVEYYKIFSGQ